MSHGDPAIRPRTPILLLLGVLLLLGAGVLALIAPFFLGVLIALPAFVAAAFFGYRGQRMGGYIGLGAAGAVMLVMVMNWALSSNSMYGPGLMDYFVTLVLLLSIGSGVAGSALVIWKGTALPSARGASAPHRPSTMTGGYGARRPAPGSATGFTAVPLAGATGVGPVPASEPQAASTGYQTHPFDDGYGHYPQNSPGSAEPYYGSQRPEVPVEDGPSERDRLMHDLGRVGKVAAAGAGVAAVGAGVAARGAASMWRDRRERARAQAEAERQAEEAKLAYLREHEGEIEAMAEAMRRAQPKEDPEILRRRRKMEQWQYQSMKATRMPFD